MGLLFKCLLGTPQRTGDDSSPLRGEDCLDEQKEGEQKDNNQNICRENVSKETTQSLRGYIGVCCVVFPQQTFLRRLSINPANGLVPGKGHPGFILTTITSTAVFL